MSDSYVNSNFNKVASHFYERRSSHGNNAPSSNTVGKSIQDENFLQQNPNTEPDMPVIHPNMNPSYREIERNVPTEFVAFSESPSQASGFGHSLFNLKGSDDFVSDMEDLKMILSSMDDPQELLKSFDNYMIRSKEIDMNMLRRSAFLKLKRYKNSVCFGEFIHGKRHGKGIMIYGPGRVYEGEWENDVKHGRGYEMLPDGSKFEGGYINGKPEGFGVFSWANGEVYEGEWKNGLKHGSGMWRGIKGESYYGEWKNGKADGYGVHIWTTGEKYEGEFKGFLKHGNGTEKFANGDTFTGNYQNGKPEGYGEYFWANGANYKGNFQNGLRQGYGVWKKGTGPNCNTYEGEWANDRKWGQGTFRWSTGNYYKGNYVDDLRHGYGEMCWVDGSKYSGSWEKGIQHGPGKLEMPGKGIKKGFFRNNLLIESGTHSSEKDYVELGERNLTNRSRNDMSEISDQTKITGKTSRATKVRSVSSKRASLKVSDVLLPTLTELSKLKKGRKSKSPFKNSFANTSMSSELTYNRDRINSALTKTEVIQWNRYKQLITSLPKTLKDFQDPEVRTEIRKLISPKKPTEKEKDLLIKPKPRAMSGPKRISRPPWRDK